MKAILLAAGKGTRMMPLTKNLPKVLVEVNGKPFLWYVFDLLQKVGISNIGLVVGYRREKIVEFLEKYDFNATIIEQQEQKGTGDAIKSARKFIGSDNFLVYHADGLYSENDVARFVNEDDFCYIAGAKVDDWKNYGILVEENGVLKQINEKPSTFVGNIASTGLYKLTANFFDLLDDLGLSSRGEVEATDAINELAKEGKVKVIELNDHWLDLGKPEDIAVIEEFLQKRG